MTKARRDIRRKLAVLIHAKETGNSPETRRYSGISREAYYKWKRKYDKSGKEGLVNGKPCPANPSLRAPPLKSRKRYSIFGGNIVLDSPDALSQAEGLSRRRLQRC
jgi:transposase